MIECQKNEYEFLLEQENDEVDADPDTDIAAKLLTANAWAQPVFADAQRRGRPSPTCRSECTCLVLTPFCGLYRMGVPSFQARRTADP